MGVAYQIRTARRVVIALGVGEPYLRICVVLVSPLSYHNTNDDGQKCPTNEGCYHLAKDGVPVVQAAQGWDRELKRQQAHNATDPSGDKAFEA